MKMQSECKHRVLVLEQGSRCHSKRHATSMKWLRKRLHVAYGVLAWKGGEDLPRDALDGKGPQRRPQKRLNGRLEEVAKSVGGGYCRLQMPLKRHLASGRQWLGIGSAPWSEAGGGVSPPAPFQCTPAPLPLRKHAGSQENTGQVGPMLGQGRACGGCVVQKEGVKRNLPLPHPNLNCHNRAP